LLDKSNIAYESQDGLNWTAGTPIVQQTEIPIQDISFGAGRYLAHALPNIIYSLQSS
jgi:hypothetical protein